MNIIQLVLVAVGVLALLAIGWLGPTPALLIRAPLTP